MTTTTRRLAAVPLALGVALALAPAASASQAATPPSPSSLLFGFSDVVAGTVPGTPGNQHQLYLLHGRTGTSGYLRSWTCPEGVTVTNNTAPDSCTHRVTQDLRMQYGWSPIARISSTGKSGIFRTAHLVGVNRASGYRRSISTDLTFYASPGASVGGADGHYVWSSALFRGSLGEGRVWVRSSDMLFGWTI